MGSGTDHAHFASGPRARRDTKSILTGTYLLQPLEPGPRGWQGDRYVRRRGTTLAFSATVQRSRLPPSTSDADCEPRLENPGLSEHRRRLCIILQESLPCEAMRRLPLARQDRTQRSAGHHRIRWLWAERHTGARRFPEASGPGLTSLRERAHGAMDSARARDSGQRSAPIPRASTVHWPFRSRKSGLHWQSHRYMEHNTIRSDFHFHRATTAKTTVQQSRAEQKVDSYESRAGRTPRRTNYAQRAREGGYGGRRRDERGRER